MLKITRIILLTVISLFSAVQIFAEEDQWPKSIFPTEQPNGNVKTITETAYTLDGVNDEQPPRFKYKLILSYSRDGRLASEEYFNKDGSPGNRIDYLYENGYLTLKTQSHPSVKNPDREIYTLTKDGRILEAEKIFSTGNYGWRYQNSYDNTGKIILTSKYDRFWKWKLVYSRMFQYNDRGELASTEGFGMNSELLWRDEHFYDESGRLTETIKYNPEGSQVVRILNEYNENGDYTRREFFDNNGISYAVYTYGWCFDEKENWTAKIIGREFQGNRSEYILPDSMVSRSIEYYK